MQRTGIVGLVGLLAFTLLCSSPCAAASADQPAAASADQPAAAPQPSLAPAAPAPAIADCQDDLSWLSEPPPGTECCGGSLVPDGCWGHCYVEVTCPDGRYVGCYGSHSQACRLDGEYAVCDGQYYGCAQCQSEQPFALGCEYC